MKVYARYQKSCELRLKVNRSTRLINVSCVIKKNIVCVTLTPTQHTYQHAPTRQWVVAAEISVFKFQIEFMSVITTFSAAPESSVEQFF